MIQKIEALLSAKTIGALTGAEYNNAVNRLFTANTKRTNQLKTEMNEFVGMLHASKNVGVIRHIEGIMEVLRGEYYNLKDQRTEAEQLIKNEKNEWATKPPISIEKIFEEMFTRP